MRSLKSIHRNF